jgi:hypothetical protein
MANKPSSKRKDKYRFRGLNTLITIASLAATLGFWNLFSSSSRQVSQTPVAAVQPPAAAAPGNLRPVSAPQAGGLRPVIQQLVDTLYAPFTPLTQTGSSR